MTAALPPDPATDGAADPPPGALGGPSTRDEGSENFPVASVLLGRAVRAPILAFYRFVRAADDVADSPDLDAAAKLARLAALERGLDDPATVLPEARALHATGTGTAEARTMLSAFRQDAVRGRYADWADLEDYCARSAEPVGRLLLGLHREDHPDAGPAADALSTALQVLNHLQDLGPDRAALDRIYLPCPWIEAAGGEAAFFDPARVEARRLVLDAALDRAEEALDRAAALPRLLRSRLSLQAAVTLALARRLLARLRAADPVAGRVALTRGDFAAAFAGAWRRGPSDAALVAARVGRAGSSFARGMAALRGGRRRALWAVYAFCRAVDDVADGAVPEAEKRAWLAGWRRKLERPDCAVSRELARARDRFALPAAECEAMIAGMETDAGDRLRLPDGAAFDLYCRRVAGSVGALSVRVFGAPAAEGFGLALGRTFQLVNVLRDVDEDAARDRVYLPRDLLEAHGVPAPVLDGPATALVAHPGFARACEAVAARAASGFADAAAALAAMPPADRRALLPAVVMGWGYRRLLARLAARGWDGPRPRPALTGREKLRMAALALGLPERVALLGAGAGTAGGRGVAA